MSDRYVGNVLLSVLKFKFLTDLVHSAQCNETLPKGYALMNIISRELKIIEESRIAVRYFLCFLLG